MSLAALLDWCQHKRLGSFNLRIHVLPRSGQVRVWIQVDQEGKRRAVVRDRQRHKLVGVVELIGSAEDVDRAAAPLLEQLDTADPRRQTSTTRSGLQLGLPFQEEVRS